VLQHEGHPSLIRTPSTSARMSARRWGASVTRLSAAADGRSLDPRTLAVGDSGDEKMGRLGPRALQNGSGDGEVSMQSEMSMDRVIVVARAIAHPVRLAMYRALGERGQSLSAVARAFGLSPAGAHHHLDVLRRSQMVGKRYVGRRAIYAWTKNRWSLVREFGPVEPSAVAGEAARGIVGASAATVVAEDDGRG
jgi:DNA-binding transcriptional ArsR family regulator